MLRVRKRNTGRTFWHERMEDKRENLFICFSQGPFKDLLVSFQNKKSVHLSFNEEAVDLQEQEQVFATPMLRCL